MLSLENLHTFYFVVAFVFFMMLFSILSFLIYIGAFYRVEVKSTKPPFKADLFVAYKFTQNSTEAQTFLTEAQTLAPHLDSFSIFHENFVHTRSQVGSSVGVILTKNIGESLYTKLMKAGFKLQILPAIEFAVVASFPYRSQHSLTIGIYRTYPLFKYYIKANRLCAHPIMELYTKEKIYFIAPLSKQFDFYAAEAIPAYNWSTSEEEEEEHSLCISAKQLKRVKKKPLYDCTNCDKSMHSPSCYKCRRAV